MALISYVNQEQQQLKQFADCFNLSAKHNASAIFGPQIKMVDDFIDSFNDV